jgi:hypothetical protein
MRRLTCWSLLLTVSLLATACGGFPDRQVAPPATEDANGATEGQDDADVANPDSSNADDQDAGSPDADGEDPDTDVPDAPEEPDTPPAPISIRLTIEPGAIVYPGTRVLPVVSIENEDGSVGDASSATVSLAPNNAAIARGARFEIVKEGALVFRACVDTEYYREGRVCTSATVLSDAGPPTIVIDEPLPAARLVGERSVTVRGRVTDTHGVPAAFLAGQAVELDEDGAFAVEVDAEFGVNHLAVTATDGIRDLESHRDLDFLWSPASLPVESDRAVVEDGIQLRLAQNFFDDDVTEDLIEGRAEVDDIAAYVELLLLHADFGAIAREYGTPRYGIEVVNAQVHEALADVTLRNDGFALRIEVPSLEIEFAGINDQGWPRLPYDGTVRTSATVYVRFQLSKDSPTDPLTLRPSNLTVNLGDLDGTFENQFTQGAWDLVHDDVRGPVTERIQNGIIAGFILRTTTSLSDGFAAADRALRVREYDVPLPGGDAELSWGASGTYVTSDEQALTIHAPLQAAAGAQLDGRGGVVSHGGAQPRHLEEGRVQAAVPLTAFNAPLHVLWGSGSLDFDGRDSLAPALAQLLTRADVTVGLPPVMNKSEDPQHTLVLQVGQVEVELEYNGEVAIFGASVEIPGNVVIERGQVYFAPAGPAAVSAWIIEDGALPGLQTSTIVDILQEAVTEHLVSALDDLRISLPQLRFYPGQILGAPGIPNSDIDFSREPTVRDGYLLMEADATFSVSVR